MSAEKCPECGTWWRGQEHRCPPVTNATGTTGATITYTATPVFPNLDAEAVAEAIRRTLLELKRRSGGKLGLS